MDPDPAFPQVLDPDPEVQNAIFSYYIFESLYSLHYF
jgi:hypothetical protein